MQRSRTIAQALLMAGLSLPMLLSGTPVLAQEPVAPTAEKGQELAGRLCQNCHVVDDNPAASVPAGIPTFRGLANLKGQTGRRIRNVLIQPHPPMPAVQLTNLEIDSLLAYLETLRTDKSSPPLISPDELRPKPTYPDKS